MDLRKTLYCLENMPIKVVRANFLIDEQDRDIDFEEIGPVKTIENLQSKKFKQVMFVLGNPATNDYWTDMLIYIDFNYYKNEQEEYQIVGEEYNADGYFIDNAYVDAVKTKNASKGLVVKKDEDNYNLFDLWQMFGVGRGVKFADFMIFIKELIEVSNIKTDVIDGDKNYFDENDNFVVQKRNFLIQKLKNSGENIETGIKRSEISYFCDKNKKVEYFELADSFTSNPKRYATFAEMVNAVHERYLFKKGLIKPNSNEQNILDGEYIIKE